MGCCWYCGGDESLAGLKLSKCAKCRVPSYCSKDCQKDDWKRLGGHKTCCRPDPLGPLIPSLPVTDEEKAGVEEFNNLQRTPILLHESRNNHWHFSARPISDKGSCIFATHPATNRTYIEGPFHLSADESLTKWAETIVPYLLSMFCVGTYSSETHDSYGIQLGGQVRAPWTWSTTNEELAIACERRLREVRVLEELCHVGWSNKGEEALEAQSVQWATMLANSNRNPRSKTRTWEGIRMANRLSNRDSTDDGSQPFPMAFEDNWDTMPNKGKSVPPEALEAMHPINSEHAIPSINDDID